MDANEQFAFPSPQPNDTPEVRSAIEQAGILWAEDPRESLKWLRKAAEFASDAGDDLRSVQLARVSADLRNLANISPSLPPTTLPPPSALVQAGIQAAQAAATSAEPNEGATGTAASDVEVATSEPAASSETQADSEGAAATDGAASSSDAGASESSGSEGGEVTPNVPAVAAQAVASGFGAQGLALEVVSDAGESQTPADGSPQPVLTPEQIAAFIPNMGLGKDPAQTVPATPAATAAAAAMANGPSTYQPFGGFQSAGYAAPAPAPKSSPAAPVPQNAGSQPRWQDPAPTTAPSNADNGRAMNTPAATPASKRPAAYGNGPGAWTGGPRPEQPTLVGSPLNGLRAEEAFRAEAANNDPSLASRFVQHRAIAVAVSMTPNSAGHFDLHPLAEGEQVEPGFRMALLVGLTADDRLFPGRG